MQKEFNDYLKNGLSEYDSKYLTTYKYVMLLSKKSNIQAYFANDDYSYFIEYPLSNKEYTSPLEVLESEMALTGCDAGVIYENSDGNFQQIAYKEKNHGK